MKLVLFQNRYTPIYCFLLAIIDLVTIYRAFIFDYSLSSAIVVILSVFGLYILFSMDIRRRTKDVVFLVLYYLWVSFRSGLFYSTLSIMSIINIVAINETEDSHRLIRRILERVAEIATICVLLQQVVHYFTGIHIPFIIESFCISNAQVQYHNLISTGIVLGMYRPSAFFAEPAGYTCYCGLALLSILCEKKPNLIKAIWVSLGIVLTTSGMGIALTFALWIWRYSIGNTQVGLSKRIKTTCLIVFGSIFMYAVLIHIPFFSRAVGRILGSEHELGALQGRVIFWNRVFAGKSIGDLILGCGPESLPQYYMTGFMVVLWSYGIIGFVLLVLFLVRCFVKGNNFVKMICLIYFGLIFIAQVTSLAYSTFIFGLILSYLHDERSNSAKIIERLSINSSYNRFVEKMNT